MQSKTMTIGTQSQPDNFNDSMLNAKIIRIGVQETMHSLMGIEVYYSENGTTLKHSHNMCSNRLSKLYYYVWEDSFSVDEDDYIQTIRGTHNEFINSIQFITYKGKTSREYGKQLGNEFSISSYGDTFSSVSGCFDYYLRSLTFQVSPLPKTFHEQQKPQGFPSLYPQPVFQSQANFQYPQQPI